jgi:hypothetical protein
MLTINELTEGENMSNEEKYVQLAGEGSINRTVEGLRARNFDSIVVENGQEAVDNLMKLIPKGASVMNGSSTTLQEIGFIDYLKSNEHGWNNLHEMIVAEKDPSKQSLLRKQSLASDYYLGSAHAVTEDGEILIASNTGSQLPNVAYGSQNVILVVGAQKIVKDLPAGFERLKDYVIALEDQRMQKVYGMGTAHNKTLLLHGEGTFGGRKILVIIVKQKLGF